MTDAATASAATSGLAPLRSAMIAEHAALGATFQWPWDIARRGGEFFAQVAGVASAITAGANAIVSSPDGPRIVAAVLADPRSSASTDQVLDSGMFGPAIDAVRADSLLRTMFVGWSSGAQVGLVGGGGGSGVASDVVDQNVSATLTYGQFTLGIGAQVSAGLLVGALAVDAALLDSSTCTFEFGAGLIGIGTFVQVIMTDDLDLIGFTLNLGAGGGFASSTGYGSISAG